MSSLAPPKPSPLAPGYRLDRYELLCPIAEGGMASVWVARLRGKHGFEKLVAIKTILPKYAADERFQQMFLDEARIASGIEHTHVAQILDLGDENGVLYLVMEWVDGDSLSKLLRAVEKKAMVLPAGIVCRLMADVSGGLHAAHELKGPDGQSRGVVHRDVSPQNILVSTKGVAKLIDFGIAKARDRVSGETSAGLLKGKVQYMAPEQALGHGLDARADIYAIGAILYHLFAGKPPYEGDNQLATLHLLTSGRPPMPLPAACPTPVANVIKKAMSHDRAARYASAAELQRAIEKAMVEAQIVTSAADVATFAATHMGERAVARKKAIDLALGAAADRARIADELKPSSTGLATPVGEASDSYRAIGAGPTPGALGAGPSQGAAHAAGPQLFAPVGGPPHEGEAVSYTSSATLGAAGVMTPAGDEEHPAGVPAARPKRLTFIVGGVVALSALIGLGAIAKRVRGGDAGDATSAARVVERPAATAIPRATPIPPPPPAPTELAQAAPPATAPATGIPAPPPTTAAAAPPASATASAAAAVKPPPAKPALATAPRPAPKPAGGAKPNKPVVDDGF